MKPMSQNLMKIPFSPSRVFIIQLCNWPNSARSEFKMNRSRKDFSLLSPLTFNFVVWFDISVT